MTASEKNRPGRRPGDPRNRGGWGTGRFPKQPARPDSTAEVELAAAQARVAAAAGEHRQAVAARNELIRRLHTVNGYPVARLGDVLRRGDPAVAGADVAWKALRQAGW